MNNLVNTRQLLAKISKEELKCFQDSLSVINKKNDLKSERLLKLLLSVKNFSSREIQIQLYGKLNYSAFNKLINRFQDKILESLTFDININRKKNYSKRNKTIFSIRKELLQADILQLKGERKIVVSMYKRIITESQKLESYDIMLQALFSYERILSSYSNKKTNLDNQIKHAEFCWLSLNKSKLIYNRIMNIISLAKDYSYYRDDLVNSVNELEEIYIKTHSGLIGYHLYTLKVEIYQNSNKYDKAEECLKLLKTLLIQNSSAFTINRYGTVLINLANNSLHLNKYEDAEKHAEESKEYFKGIPFSLMLVDEFLFYCSIYAKKYKLSLTIVEKLLKASQAQNVKLFNKYLFFSAYLNFQNNNYDLSIENILLSLESDSDKGELGIYSRLLLLLNRIELNDNIQIELQLQSLEKYLKRNGKNDQASKRVMVIYKILSSLINENFNYEKVFLKKQKYFKVLESENGLYSWKTKSMELLPFHIWFKNKIS